jgi:hypothetical protein
MPYRIILQTQPYLTTDDFVIHSTGIIECNVSGKTHWIKEWVLIKEV